MHVGCRLSLTWFVFALAIASDNTPSVNSRQVAGFHDAKTPKGESDKKTHEENAISNFQFNLEAEIRTVIAQPRALQALSVNEIAIDNPVVSSTLDSQSEVIPPATFNISLRNDDIDKTAEPNNNTLEQLVPVASTSPTTSSMPNSITPTISPSPVLSGFSTHAPSAIGTAATLSKAPPFLPKTSDSLVPTSKALRSEWASGAGVKQTLRNSTFATASNSSTLSSPTRLGIIGASIESLSSNGRVSNDTTDHVIPTNVSNNNITTTKLNEICTRVNTSDIKTLIGTNGIRQAVMSKPTTEQFFSAVKQLNKLVNEHEDWVPTLVRASFHDCVPPDGCNGCINLLDDHNAGLRSVIEALILAYDRLNELQAPFMSFADFIALAGSMSVIRSVNRTNVNNPTFAPLPSARMFRLGRTDCTSSPWEWVGSAAISQFPDAYFNMSQVVDFFGIMNMTPVESVAIIGAHSLGGLHPANSGFEGPWNLPTTLMNNGLFHGMVNNPWEFFELPSPNGVKRFWRANGVVLLSSDLALYKNIGVDVDGRVKCGDASPGSVHQCSDTPLSAAIQNFASNNTHFILTFYDSFTKLIEHNARDLYDAPISLLDALDSLYHAPPALAPSARHILISSNLDLGWLVHANSIEFTMRTQAPGWVAIGFGGSMTNADIILCQLSIIPYNCKDMWSSDRTQPMPDVLLGGRDNLSNVTITKTENGWFVVDFTRPLIASDKYDKAITPGPNSVIWAYSPLEGGIYAHQPGGADDHGLTIIDFLDEQQGGGSQPTDDSGGGGSGNKSLTSTDFMTAIQAIVKVIDVSPSLIPSFVRLSFHDCLPPMGCNGCVNLRHEGNAGLREVTEALVVAYTRINELTPPTISFADFVALAGSIAVLRAANTTTTQQQQQQQHPNYTPLPPANWFQIGRVDCASSPFERPNIENPSEFPSPYYNSHELTDFFARMGLSERESVAIIGAHALGGLHAQNSGFSGVWVPPGTVLDNGLYRNMIKVNWTFTETEPILGNKKYYWIGRENAASLLTADLVLYKNVSVTPEGKVGCGNKIPGSVHTLCPDSSLVSVVKEYANNNTMFLTEFYTTWQKMLRFGSIHLTPAPLDLVSVLATLTSSSSDSNSANTNKQGCIAQHDIFPGINLGWLISNTSIAFTLRTRVRGWVAIGLGASMLQADVIFCTLFGVATCTDGWSSGYTVPLDDTLLGAHDDVTNVFINQVDGWFDISFTRPLAAMDSRDMPILREGNDLIFAYSDHEGSILPHNPGNADDHGHAFANLYENKFTLGNQKCWSVYALHGVAMFTGWGVVYPMGIWVARYARHKDWWQSAHKDLMSFGAASAVMLGLATIYSQGIHVTKPHHFIGLVLSGITFTQVALGLFARRVVRQGANVRMFLLIRWSHHLLGYGMMILSYYNIYLGIGLFFGEKDYHQRIFLGYLGFLLLIVLVSEAFMAWGHHKFFTSTEGTKREVVRRQLTQISYREFLQRVQTNAPWIIIDGFVCNVRTWRKSHPGGLKLLQNSIGCDATLAFFGVRHPLYWIQTMNKSEPRAIKRQTNLSVALAQALYNPRSERQYKHNRNAYARMLETAVHTVKYPFSSRELAGYEGAIEAANHYVTKLRQGPYLGATLPYEPGSVQKAVLLETRLLTGPESTKPVMLFRFAIGVAPEMTTASLTPIAAPPLDSLSPERTMRYLDARRLDQSAMETALSSPHLPLQSSQPPITLVKCSPGNVANLLFFTMSSELVERPYDVVSDLVEQVRDPTSSRSSSDSTSRGETDDLELSEPSAPMIARARILELVIKLYGGLMTSYLAALTPGDTVSMYFGESAPVLNPRSVNRCWEKFAWIVRGTGATPSIPFVRYHLAHIAHANNTTAAGEKHPPPPPPPPPQSEPPLSASAPSQSRRKRPNLELRIYLPESIGGGYVTRRESRQSSVGALLQSLLKDRGLYFVSTDSYKLCESPSGDMLDPAHILDMYCDEYQDKLTLRLSEVNRIQTREERNLALLSQMSQRMDMKNAMLQRRASGHHSDSLASPLPHSASSRSSRSHHRPASPSSQQEGESEEESCRDFDDEDEDYPERESQPTPALSPAVRINKHASEQSERRSTPTSNKQEKRTRSLPPVAHPLPLSSSTSSSSLTPFQSSIVGRVLTSSPSASDEAFRSFFERAEESSLGAIQLYRALSEANKDEENPRTFLGSVTVDMLQDVLHDIPPPLMLGSDVDADIYANHTALFVCGPSDFMQDVTSMLLSLNYPRQCIRVLNVSKETS